jgi:hypothetical protein
LVSGCAASSVVTPPPARATAIEQASLTDRRLRLVDQGLIVLGMIADAGILPGGPLVADRVQRATLMARDAVARRRARLPRN